MIISNKKGQIQYFLENAFRVGFLMIALVVFFLLINFYIVNKIDTRQLQAEVLANRIIYSDTIMMTDDTHRIYSGIIDMTKFNEETLNNKINYPIKKHATAKLEVKDNVNGKIIDTTYLNKVQYDNLDVLSKSKSNGKGSSSKYTKVYPVTYYTDGQYKYGTLTLVIIVPNS